MTTTVVTPAPSASGAQPGSDVLIPWLAIRPFGQPALALICASVGVAARRLRYPQVRYSRRVGRQTLPV